MKKTVAVLAVTSAFGLVANASAVAITGQLVMDGTVNLNDPSLATATEVSSFGADVYAGGASDGVFEAAGFDGELVTINGFNFTSSPFSTVDPLWTVTSGSETFSFALTGVSVLKQNANFLDILGTGYIYSVTPGSEYTQTPGTFSFSISDSDGIADDSTTFKFGFTANSSASAVPDGGATACLLGAGILGLAALRRRS